MTGNNKTSLAPTHRALTPIAPFAVGALATAIAFLLFRNSFTGRVATHFTLDGDANGFSSPAAALGQYMLVFLIEAVGIGAALISAKTAITTVRALGIFAWGLASATACLFVLAMWVSTGTEGQERLSTQQVVIAVAVGLAVAVAGWFVARKRA
ncbi:hypothetical protein AMK16_30095 [Streptomyces sp. CB00455]|uniref:hypothetical protein n=1 Tax=Streptomyces sp. CB00455 TaxID=1703927 RepID=UPI00093A6B9A|nr:hypothetical protein [Streptomyces sp. CB00455]OKK14786.1 hypothetical protein AMK16_30095 [Streptomyces sp. CB00455]